MRRRVYICRIITHFHWTWSLITKVVLEHVKIIVVITVFCHLINCVELNYKSCARNELFSLPIVKPLELFYSVNMDVSSDLTSIANDKNGGLYIQLTRCFMYY